MSNGRGISMHDRLSRLGSRCHGIEVGEGLDSKRISGVFRSWANSSGEPVAIVEDESGKVWLLYACHLTFQK